MDVRIRGMNMVAVEITGWEKDCNTVAAIKEIRTRAGVPLNAALALVNRVLNDEQVTVSVQCLDDGSWLVDELGKVGMISQVTADSFTQPLAAIDRP